VVVIQYLECGDDKLDPEETRIVDCSPITIVAKAVERKNGVEKVIIELNGEPVFEEANLRKKEYRLRVPITLKEKENKLTILAYSTKKVKSHPAQISITYKEELLRGKSLPELVRHYFGRSRNWAVVIGINSYDKKRGFKRLKYAKADAEAVKEHLIEHLGFSEERVISIYDRDATKSRIEKVLGDELPKKLKKEDRLLVFFAGHGETRKTRKRKDYGYLVPVDGDKSSLHSTCIPMDQVVYSFSELIPAKQILFIIDACFSGIAGISYRKGKITKETRKQVEIFLKSEGRQIMTAGSSKEKVAEGKKWGGHSVYTFYLLKGLKGEADYNKDEVISVHELQVYLEDKVPKEAKQTPQLYRLSGEGQFMFH
jgi:hypothetical protein